MNLVRGHSDLLGGCCHPHHRFCTLPARWINFMSLRFGAESDGLRRKHRATMKKVTEVPDAGFRVVWFICAV